MKILDPPGQLLFLYPEDSLLEVGPQKLASFQHTITNHLDEEKREYCHAGDIMITLVEPQLHLENNDVRPMAVVDLEFRKGEFRYAIKACT